MLCLKYQYLVIRKGKAFHTFLVPFSVYSYQKQLSKNTEKTTGRADQTTCISLVIVFFEDFLPDWKKWTLRHGPFTHDQHNSIFKFLGGVTEVNYQEIHIFRPKKVMMNRLYCLDRQYCSHFCTGVSLLITWFRRRNGLKARFNPARANV